MGTTCVGMEEMSVPDPSLVSCDCRQSVWEFV